MSIESETSIIELGQYKYNAPKTVAKLTDGSKGLWNTLGIWASAILDKSVDVSTIHRFILFTRAVPDPGSLVEAIVKDEDRQIDDIRERLLSIPISSSPKLAKSFLKVHSLPKSDLDLFLEKFYIKAQMPNLQETIDILRKKIRQKGFHPHSIDEAAKDFAGWMWEKVLGEIEKEEGIRIIMVPRNWTGQ